MGVISKGGIRGENKRPGRACQHCDFEYVQKYISSLHSRSLTNN